MDESVLVEAISRGLREGLLDVAARLMPEVKAGLRAERLEAVAVRAMERGDQRAALECRAAAFADVPTEDRLAALDQILAERGDLEARARAIALFAERASGEERADLMVRRAELYRAVGDPMAEADALIDAIRAMPLDASPEAILARLERVSTADADQAILGDGLEGMGEREQPIDDGVAAFGWADDVLSGNTSDQVRQLSDAVGSLLSRVAEPIPLPDAPLLRDTQGDGVPLSPAEAVQLHLSAGDVESLVERLHDAVDRGEELDRATWLRAGRFLSSMGRVLEARQALLRATGARPAWDRAAAETLAAQGDHREAARALVATETPAGAVDLRWLGELYLADGDDAEAARWLERALELDPKDGIAAARLLDLASRANQFDRVDRVLSAHPSFASAAWHLAAARALRRRGDPGQARAAIEQALALDLSLLEPAMLLFDLGREHAEETWIDRALFELRVRALGRGLRSRALMASGLLVARGTASEEDRLTYEALRIDLSTAPRATLPAGWADRWLVHVEAPANEVSFDEARARTIDLEPGLLDALEAGEGVFGVADVLVVGLAGEGPTAAVWDDPPRIGFAHHELVRWLPKTFRFEVGRALAALTEPRLRGGLVDAQLTAEGPLVLLDRAGLVLAQDPVPVLESIGARSPRGRALTAFAVSDELYGLWARVGLGVVPPNATVAKPAPSA